MEISKKLKIGGHSIKVIFHDPILGTSNEAHLDNSKNLIVIDSTLSHSAQAVSLLHEILHRMNSTIDHVFMASLAEQLYQVLKDNKLKF